MCSVIFVCSSNNENNKFPFSNFRLIPFFVFFSFPLHYPTHFHLEIKKIILFDYISHSDVRKYKLLKFSNCIFRNTLILLSYSLDDATFNKCSFYCLSFRKERNCTKIKCALSIFGWFLITAFLDGHRKTNFGKKGDSHVLEQVEQVQ